MLIRCNKEKPSLSRVDPRASGLSIRRTRKGTGFLRLLQRNSARVLTHLIIFYPTPPFGQDMTQGQFFKRSFTGLKFRVFPSPRTNCLTQAEEPSQPYYLPIAGGRIIGFIPFPRVLVLCKMQSFLVQDLNSCHRVHFLRRQTITPRAPPQQGL